MAPLTDIPAIELAVLDMAGTTIDENGAVSEAVDRAIESIRMEPVSREKLSPLRGISKKAMFDILVPQPARAAAAYNHFVDEISASIRSGRIAAKTGSVDVLKELGSRGLKTCLVTGFPSTLRAQLLETLGWEELIDLSLSPESSGRGRPNPDAVLTAILKLKVSAVQSVAVIGDTSNDIAAGTRAGASIVAGVLGGAHSADQLMKCRPTHILESILEFPDILYTQNSSS